MRGIVAAWLGVAGVVALACVVVATVDEPGAVGVFMPIHRHFPRPTRVISGTTVLAKNVIGFRGRRVEHVAGDGKKMRWNFNPFNPFHTFGVRREGHGHKKCGMAAKLGFWWLNMFGHHHDLHDRLHHHDDEEHHQEHDHEHRFGRDMEHQHRHRASFGWALLVKIGRWFSGIPSFLSDVPAVIRTWSARAGGRKPPTVESVTEPLDMRSLQKTYSPSPSCVLREKLLQVFAAASEEVDATTGSADDDESLSDVIKRNLKKFMGDSMQLRIAKSICDSASMSSCEQDFCHVFRSHHKSGVLMAFRVLGLNPVRASITAARLSISRSLSRSVQAKNEMDVIMNLKKSLRLAHIVFQRVLAEYPIEESLPDLMHKLKNLFPKFSSGEPNSCEACLRLEIFRLKNLTKKVMVEGCENPVDSCLEQTCNFAKENRFVFKTLFAYKFRLWEKAAFVCRTQKACDSLPTHSAGTYEPESITWEKMHNLRIVHFDVNTFRDPRGVEATPAVMANPMHGKTQNCRQRALHRAAMLRGRSLDALASELLKVDDSLSLQHERGPIIVLEFVGRSHLENGQEAKGFPSAMNFEHGFPGSAEFDPLREIMKRPLFDSSPVHSDAAMEDAFFKPQDVPDVTSITTEFPLELPSSNESSRDNLDM